MPRQTNDSRTDFNDFFVYDETSPSCLRWKQDMRNGKGIGKVFKAKGSVAGCLSTHDYWGVCLHSVHYKVHRVVYQMHHGDLCADDLVDHKFGECKDNRISGLKKTCSSGNAQNQQMYSNNTSGKTGVLWQNKIGRTGNSHWYATAQWNDLTGVKKSKAFSVSVFGVVEAFALACQYRDKMIETLNTLGANYTVRHGK